MKHLLTRMVLVVVFVQLITHQVVSQIVVLESQDEVDNFQTDYPDNINLDELFIIGDDITDLSPLLGIFSVNKLVIANALVLTDLSGLSNLNFVNQFEVSQSPLLSDINLNVSEIGSISLTGPLPALDLASTPGINNGTHLTIQGDFENLQGLEMITGLKSLCLIGSGIMSFEGLDNLSFIEENLLVDGVSANDAGFSHLSSLESIGSGAQLLSCPNLNELDFISGVSFEGEDVNFTVSGNPNVNSCDQLDLCGMLTDTRFSTNLHDNGLSCPTIAGSTYVATSNQKVVDFMEMANSCDPSLLNLRVTGFVNNIEPLADISEIGSIELEGLGSTDLTPIQNLIHVNGDFILDDVFNLNEISGFDNLTTVDGSFIIRNNNNLVSLSGFDNLISIGGDIIITNNQDDLIDISGFNNITEVSGDVLILFNDHLETVDGFSQIENINGNFRIRKNNSFGPTTEITVTGFNSLSQVGSLLSIELMTIENISFLNKLTSVGEELRILGLNSMLDLTGLESLEFAGEIIIQGNDDLISINQINQSFVSEDIDIRFNDNLQICDVPWICSNVESANSVTVSSNGPVCDSPDQIEIQCYTDASLAISNFQTNNCIDIPSVEISAAIGNTNEPVVVLDELGDIVCVVNANGNDLGLVDFQLFISESLRVNNTSYANRDIGIFPEFEPESEIEIVFYYRNADIAAIAPEVDALELLTDIEMVVNAEQCTGVFEDGFTQGFGESFKFNSDCDLMKRINTIETGIFFGSSNIQGIIPVEFVSFDAFKKDNLIQLEWVTASEINNDLFIVQHSTDGERFSALGTVKGQGTSSSVNNYSFDHTNPFQGLNYYRLKQIDFDGSAEYSDIIIIDFDGIRNLRVFPNPTADIMEIQNYDGSVVRIFNHVGELILQENPTNGRLDISELTPGIYYLRLGRERHKVVKI